jgi:hypothetical protein
MVVQRYPEVDTRGETRWVVTLVMTHTPDSMHEGLGGSCEAMTSVQTTLRFLLVKSSVVLIRAEIDLTLAMTAVIDVCIATAHISPTSFPAMKCFRYRPSDMMSYARLKRKSVKAARDTGSVFFGEGAAILGFFAFFFADIVDVSRQINQHPTHYDPFCFYVHVSKEGEATPVSCYRGTR